MTGSALFVSGKPTTPSDDNKFNECCLLVPRFNLNFLLKELDLCSLWHWVYQVMEAAQASTGLAGGIRGGSALQNVNHIAHLSGALIGVALIWLLSGISSQATEPDARNNKK